MTLFEAAILGVVQGITEYLPISSTAHLRVVPALLGWDDPGAAYSAVIQLGTLLAVFIYFRKDLLALSIGSFRDLRSEKHWGPDARMTAAILIGTIPIGLCGIFFKSAIKNELRSLWVIASTLILLALALAWADRRGRHERNAASLTFWNVQFIALAQALALIPGVSRSGVTLTAALLIGLKRDEAARFSFLLGIPAIGAAGLFGLKELFEDPAASGILPALIVGTVASFIAGIAAIEVLLRYLKTRSAMIFVWYRIALGIGLALLLYRGILVPF